MPKSVCFSTKIIATTWSTNKIIPVSIALEKGDDDGRKRGNFVNKPRQWAHSIYFQVFNSNLIFLITFWAGHGWTFRGTREIKYLYKCAYLDFFVSFKVKMVSNTSLPFCWNWNVKKKIRLLEKTYKFLVSSGVTFIQI